ncbi:phosphotransferase [Desulfococcaceae bacterium HSG9]|nr:phosphotransferase [Desulfococcaceae bacterium HSG9]
MFDFSKFQPKQGASAEANQSSNLRIQSLAPHVYHIDNNRQHFDFDILIEQYLEGPPLTLEKFQLPKVAAVLAKLHSLRLDGMKFITWQDPLEDTYNFVKKDIAHYEIRKTAEQEIITLTEQILKKIRPRVLKTNLPFKAVSLNHTDAVCDNFILTPQGLRLIDWEKPRQDDCTYDLSCFLAEPAQLWCSDHVLDTEEREDFITEYARLSGKNAELLRQKVRIREPMVALHWMLWGATKLCDLREARTTLELLEAHEEKTARYETLSQVESFEKLLEEL